MPSPPGVVVRARPGRIHAQYRAAAAAPEHRGAAAGVKERMLEDLDFAVKGGGGDPEFAI